MEKSLVKYDDDYALVIDKPLIDLLNITNNTVFEITSDGRNLILSPKNTDDDVKDIEYSLKKVNEKYGTILKKLGE
jgi:hypothetical protein